MPVAELVVAIQWFFLLYFIGINAGYLGLYTVSLVNLWKYMQVLPIESQTSIYSGLEPPISVLVPAYNEERTIATSVRSLLQLNYPEYEVLVIDDGSSDSTMDILIREFSLTQFPEAYRVQLKTEAVFAVYQSTVHANLRVIRKKNGGKSDALNAGINASRYPLFCCVDADSILQRNSLERVVQPFLDDPDTVAAGGTIRIVNGCEVVSGMLVKTDLPNKLLPMIQIVEYLRAFLFGRLGWSPMNALLIISGAFGLFNKQRVIEVGGYQRDTVGEDMELIVRLHRHLRLSSTPYRISFVPAPICWTEAPEDLKSLRAQRMRWQRGLAESLSMNIRLLFHPKSGTAGWLAFPFMAVFEWWGPVVEILGYICLLLAFLFGVLSLQALIAFLVVAIGFGLLLSVCALLLEELSFHIYTRPKHVLLLLMAVIVENFGYRQLVAIWRLLGLFHWLSGMRAKWGDMRRKAHWQQTAE